MYYIVFIDYENKESHSFKLESHEDWNEWLDGLELYKKGSKDTLLADKKFTDGDEEWVLI